MIDTSIFCEILKVPGKSNQHEAVLEELTKKIEAGSTLFLPYSTIIETGNHIAQVKKKWGNSYEIAKNYVKTIENTLLGQAPWVALSMPNEDDLKEWLPLFPDYAAKTIGAGDATIIGDYSKLCKRHRYLTVAIWSLDQDLKGYVRVWDDF